MTLQPTVIDGWVVQVFKVIPAKIIIYDTDAGNTLGMIEVAQDVDDIFYDPRSNACMPLAVQDSSASSGKPKRTALQLWPKIAPPKGARTSLFVPEQGRMYLAVPHRGEQPAAVRVYRLQP